MPLPSNLNRYADVAEVFELALAREGGKVVFATRAEATRWRMRAYGYRKLLRQISMIKADSPDPIERMKAGLTPYDDFYLRLVEDGEKFVIVIYLQEPVNFQFIPGGDDVTG